MASDSSPPIGASAGKTQPARLLVEPVTLFIVAYFLVSLACILALFFLNQQMDKSLEQYTLLQGEHHTISEVALVAHKQLSSIQNSFQQMLLASSTAELETARDTISEGMQNLRRAADFFVEGGSFTENFAVNFDNLEKVTHTFTLTGLRPGFTVAALELRSSLSLLEKVLEEYHSFMRQSLASAASLSGVQHSRELAMMHKKLNPYFVRAMEHSNRFYAQSMIALQKARQERELQAEHHQRTHMFLFVAALLLLSLVGGLVLHQSKRVLDERAERSREVGEANERLKNEVRVREQAQEALATSEQELRDLYALAPVGIFTSSPEGCYLSVNQTLATMYGYDSPEELLAEMDSISRRIYVDPPERGSLRGILDAQGRITNHEILRKTRGGAEIWVSLSIRAVKDKQGSVICYQGFSIDITSAKQAEAELRMLNQAMENAPVSVVITDTEGIIRYVNPYFTEASGYSRQEVLGQSPRMLKSGRHEGAFYQDMWVTISRGETWRGEVINKRKDGTLFWESSSISPLRDEQGAITSYVAVKEVITDRKDLERLKEDVDRIMRHDLKTPLNAIIGFPQMLLINDNLEPAQAEMIKVIEEAGRRMLSMIDLSLDLLKMEQGTYEYVAEPVDILVLLRQLAEQNSAILAAKELPFTMLVNGSEPKPSERIVTLSEERLLYSLLGNLLRNAIEASPAGHSITCEIRSNGVTSIALCNSGVVPEVIREHFFEKYRTHGKSSGTGLGTYSAKLLAVAMGHDLRMETSDALNSTCLTVIIPGRHNAEDQRHARF